MANKEYCYLGFARWGNGIVEAILIPKAGGIDDPDLAARAQVASWVSGVTARAPAILEVYRSSRPTMFEWQRATNALAYQRLAFQWANGSPIRASIDAPDWQNVAPMLASPRSRG